MKLLTWHIAGTVPKGTGLRETYRLDGEYVPVRAWVHLGTAPLGDDPLILDINVDGVSIFAFRPLIITKETDYVQDSIRTFSAAVFIKDAMVTLDVDQVGSGEPGKDMTVGLELFEA